MTKIKRSSATGNSQTIQMLWQWVTRLNYLNAKNKINQDFKFVWMVRLNNLKDVKTETHRNLKILRVLRPRLTKNHQKTETKSLTTQCLSLDHGPIGRTPTYELFRETIWLPTVRWPIWHKICFMACRPFFVPITRGGGWQALSQKINSFLSFPVFFRLILLYFVDNFYFPLLFMIL